MRYKDLPPGTILVGRSFSNCNNCGEGTLTQGERHDRAIGYGYNEEGCGVEWTHIYSTYMGQLAEDATVSLRPDLVFIPTLERQCRVRVESSAMCSKGIKGCEVEHG